MSPAVTANRALRLNQVELPRRAAAQAAAGRVGHFAGRLSAIFSLALLAGCDVIKLGAMNAAGPIAAEQRHLYIVVGVVLVFVAGPVLLLTPVMAWYYRRSNKRNAFKPKWNFSWPLEGLIWIPPTGIVIGLGILLWHATHRLDPYRPIPSTQPPLRIQAVALDWKWLFIYPDEHVAVINQMAIPAGRPIRIELTSGTVMQSLLIPRLAGQIYAMAGMRTELNLAADKPGVYGGANTQYNGAGFPRQKFDTVALSPADYQKWLTRVRAIAHPLNTTDYNRLFERSVPPGPIFYSAVPDDLFRRLLARGRTSSGPPR